jgi:hypothetical protein
VSAFFLGFANCLHGSQYFMVWPVMLVVLLEMMVSSQLFYSCQLSCLDRSVVVSQEVLVVVVSGDFLVTISFHSCVLVLSAV